MSALSLAVDDYLTVRRTLGHKLHDHGRLLPDFVAYLEAAGASTITTELALAWATQPTSSTPVWWGRRLAMVRGFAQHVKAIDPDTEIPLRGLLPYRCRRANPYLYSDADIAALMGAARGLPSPLRAATYQTLIGLIAATGLRSGEALRLDRDHIDWDDGVITVWDSKFHKSRALPVHPTTLTALEDYARLRDGQVGDPKTASFFVTRNGTRPNANGVRKVFAGLVRRAGLAPDDGGRAPRLHDLRHRFACTVLVGWYRAGVDVEVRLPLLSTYMGHDRTENSFWYLSAVPELLFLASERLERAEEARS